MKTIILKLILVVFPFLQESNSILLKTKFSNKEAVIFNKQYTEVLVLQKGAIRFTPNEAHILEAEQILCDTVTNFRNQYRQYAGYLSNKQDSVLVANVLSPKVIARSADNWKKEYILGLGKFYEKNQRILYFNLTSGKIFNPGQ